jgi:hypothetical protein
MLLPFKRYTPLGLVRAIRAMLDSARAFDERNSKPAKRL